MGMRDSGIHLKHRRQQGLRWICAAVASACATTIVPATQGATSFWTNPAGGTYHDASNWNGGAGPAPGPSDTAEFDLAATYPITFAFNSGAGTFNQTAGDVTLLTDGSAKSLSFGPFNVLGGNLTLGSSGARLDIQASSVQVGSGGSATVGFGNRLHMSSGSLSIGTADSGSAALTVDGTNSKLNSDSASGVFLLGGAADTSSASGSLTVSNNAIATPRGITMTRGTIAVQTGADVTCSGNIALGTQSSVLTPAMMTVTGAGSTFLQDAGSFFDVGYTGTSSSATSNPASLMISSSGTVTTNFGGTLRIGHSGTVDFTGGNLVIKGGVLVSGGTLTGTTPATPLLPATAHIFTVDSGGTVNLTGGAAVDLAPVGSINGHTFLVKDAGSTFTADGTLLVRGGSSFTVGAGGTLSVPGMQISSTNFSSTAVIDGAGALLLSGPVIVGESGSNFQTVLALKNGGSGTVSGALAVYSGSSKPLEIESGAALTVNGPVMINTATYSGSLTGYVTGTGSSFTQSGANAMTIGRATGSSTTSFKSSFGGVISTGTGLLTVSGLADVGAGSGGSFNVNGDVLINQSGKLTLTSWASGKTMTLLMFAACHAGDLTLVGNTINLQGPIASFSGGTVTLNGGSSLNVQDTGSAAFTHLHLGTDGTAGSLIVGSVSSQHVTTSGSCDWGAAGGSATVTLNPTTAVDLAANSPLNLASTGTGTTAQVLIDRAVMTLGSLNMQDATTGAASATLTIQGNGGRLEQRLPTSSSIGGTAGSGTATINVRDGGVLLASGTLVLKSTGTLDLSAGTVDLDSLSLSGGKLKFHSGALTITQTPSATNGGQLDLEDNAFVVRTSNVGTWDGSAYTGVTGLIVSGRNGGSWDGTGVITSQTNAIGSNHTTIAVARASEVRPITGTQTAIWAGYTVSSSNVLVMYTYGGDATLDGKINIDDYVKIDSGSAGGLTGWSNGDFNYDGSINIDDYTTVIDANIGNQNGFVFPTAIGIDGVAAIPEPGGGVLAGIAALAFARRRGRRRG
jgi:hypothetical protein